MAVRDTTPFLDDSTQGLSYATLLSKFNFWWDYVSHCTKNLHHLIKDLKTAKDSDLQRELQQSEQSSEEEKNLIPRPSSQAHEWLSCTGLYTLM